MTADEVGILIVGLLTDNQNNGYIGDLEFKISLNQEGISSCKMTKDVELKDKRSFYKAKVKLKK